MELNSILLKYDHLIENVFQELDAFNEIDEFYKKQIEAQASFQIAQKIALGFSENFSEIYDAWGTYYGPMYVAGGIESPSIKLVNIETLENWKVILKLVNHPILKARYSGLIWDFTKFITGEFPDIEFCIININSLIKVSELKNAQNEYTVFRKLERAINLSLKIKNKQLFELSKNALIGLEDRVDKYDKTGIWGYAFDILIANKNKHEISELDEVKIITKLNFIFKHFCELGRRREYDPFTAEHAVSRLIVYYKMHNNYDSIFLMLKELKTLYLGLINSNPSHIVTGWLERLIFLFDNNNHKGALDLDIKELLIKLKKINSNSINQLKTVEFSTIIEKSEFDQIDLFVEKITSGNLDEIFINISYHFIPDEEKANNEILKLSKENHIRHLIGTVVYDNTGKIIAKIGSLKSDPEGHLVLYLIDYFKFNYLILSRVLNKLKDKDVGIIELQKYLYLSSIFDEIRKPILNKALEAYYKSDHLAFAHLIIPQIESIIRNIINKAGGTSIALKKNGTFEEVTFEKALNDPIIEGILGKNLVRYFRVIYIDKKGWNFRNRISHGLMEPNAFNQMTSDYIFHTLICLGLVRIN